MLKRVLLLSFILMFCAATAFAAGMEPGVSVRAVEKNGLEIVGVIAAYEGRAEISVLDQSGHYFKMPLKDVRRISGVPGQTIMTGGGTKLSVATFEMVNGQAVQAGISDSAIFKIDMGVKGKRNLWATDDRYQFVEVVEQAPAAAAGTMKVKTLDGRIISVPVRKDEVQSIIFE